MILTIKAKQCNQLPDGTWQLLTDCEELKQAFNSHSPNILVDYLNERYHTSIGPIDYKRKEADHGTV